MSTGTLDPLGQWALRPRVPKLRLRNGRNAAAMAIAVAQSVGLTGLVLVGALPHLLAGWQRPRRR